MSNITPQEAQQIAEEAYTYSFPILMGYRWQLPIGPPDRWRNGCW